MTTIECSSCRKKPLSKDEVGVCKGNPAQRKNSQKVGKEV